MELSEIREQAARAAEEVCAAAKLRVGDLFVVGCSSSEVCGEKIGTHSSVEVAEAVFEGIYSVIEKHGLFLAAQCCEHLNRALIVERAAAEKFGLDEVNVIPQPKAGGSFGTTAYKRFEAGGRRERQTVRGIRRHGCRQYADRHAHQAGRCTAAHRDEEDRRSAARLRTPQTQVRRRQPSCL